MTPPNTKLGRGGGTPRWRRYGGSAQSTITNHQSKIYTTVSIHSLLIALWPASVGWTPSRSQ